MQARARATHTHTHTRARAGRASVLRRELNKARSAFWPLSPAAAGPDGIEGDGGGSSSGGGGGGGEQGEFPDIVTGNW